ncbi:MAG: type III-B CRISPR module-associated protein Cmr5 [Verrucomicrobiia bacterium]|jgi:CRISPR type III-B/RAMP module-associated protein Cmr5
MKNLDQIRASNALKKAKDISKSDVNRIPALIVNNGLLATLAFATEMRESENGQKKYAREKMKQIMDCIAEHLSGDEIGIDVLKGCTNASKLLDRLTNVSFYDLQKATDEALHYLSYLKRFAMENSQE